MILLKSSSCLKSSSDMLLDTPLKTKTLSFFAFAEWYDLGSDILTFPENLLHFWLALQDSKVFGSISYEDPAVFCLFDFIVVIKTACTFMMPGDFGVYFYDAR